MGYKITLLLKSRPSSTKENGKSHFSVNSVFIAYILQVDKGSEQTQHNLSGLQVSDAFVKSIQFVGKVLSRSLQCELTSILLAAYFIKGKKLSMKVQTTINRQSSSMPLYVSIVLNTR